MKAKQLVLYVDNMVERYKKATGHRILLGNWYVRDGKEFGQTNFGLIRSAIEGGQTVTIRPATVREIHQIIEYYS